jgi:signal peptidase complex subunit 1
MDFKGQKLSETACVWIVTVAAVLAFLYGYVRQDFQAMMVLFGGGCTAAFVATVPDWPVYNKNPITWLPPKEDPARRGGSGSGARGAGGKGGGKKKSSSWASLFGF